MTGRDLVRSAMRLRDVERAPWVPFVGCHGGSLIGMDASAYLASAEAVVRGTAEAVRRYRPDGIPVFFDLQVEAEALGCKLVWAPQNPPAVVSHPLAEGKPLGGLEVPGPGSGRLPVALEAARRLRAAHPDLALYGLVTGPFTLALHLAGTDLFMRMYDDEKSVHDLMGFCRQVSSAVSGYYLDAGCDVVALVDPMTSQIGPDQFRRFVAGPVTEVFAEVRRRGGLGSFFVCGHAQQNIEAMGECRPDNISIDENIPLDFVRDLCLPRGISFGGNLKLTVVLLMGTPADAQKNALACLEEGGGRGFILAPGCDLPYATPPENLEAVARVVHDPYEREVARTMERHEEVESVLDMSQYGRSDRVIVDIITLDSESCAPCQYMVESVRRVAPQFEGVVEWREHKIKKRESVQFMTSLMVRNIPTICIDGTITFVSRIPPKEELVAAIQKRIFEKLRYRIRTKRGEILILGRTAEEIRGVRPVVEQAIVELGSSATVTEVSDEKELLSYGVVRTPAVVAASYRVKHEGGVPPLAAVKEWIKEIG